MRNIKTIVSFSVAGFILSLIFGIFSNSGFFRVLFVALAWAVAFALLGFLVSFVYNKFLQVETSSYTSTDISSPNTQAPKATSPSLGSNVDIVVEDQELDRTESVNRYSVGQNHQMLNDSDLEGNKAASSVAQSNAAASDNSGFIPVRNLETYKNFSGTESVKPSELKSEDEEELEEIEEIETPKEQASQNGPAINADSEGLDVLPDMGAYVVDGDSSVNTNDGFGYAGSGYSDPSYGNSKQKVDGENMQNTELIAKAISSVLSAET